MKRHLISHFLILIFVFAFAILTSAQQLTLPRPSQKASVMQTVGVTDITITYFRPGVKGRLIFAEAPKTMADRAKGQMTLDNSFERQPGEPIVPYGYMWRTGANDATQFTVSDDVMINGQKLAAGSYSLHTIPGKTEWTIIFNGAANQWGSFNYDASKDTLRVKAKPESVKDNQEWLMFSFDPVANDSATVNIRWEKTRVPFTVTVDTVATAMAKALSFLTTAKPDNWGARYSVGNYAVQNKLNDEGMTLLAEALRMVDESIKTKETYQNLAGRANILFSMNRKDEGFAAAAKAIAFGKANKANTAGLESRVADLKAGKM
ncbi:MAG: DUF2911 domain-containing protein [Pyrinomonadaceae bacterium]